MADILAKHFQVIPVIGKALAATIQYAAASFIKTVLGKKLSGKTSKVFPLGYFVVVEKVASAI